MISVHESNHSRELTPSVRSAFEKAQMLVLSVPAPMHEPVRSGTAELDFTIFDGESLSPGA